MSNCRISIWSWVLTATFFWMPLVLEKRGQNAPIETVQIEQKNMGDHFTMTTDQLYVYPRGDDWLVIKFLGYRKCTRMLPMTDNKGKLVVLIDESETSDSRVVEQKTYVLANVLCKEIATRKVAKKRLGELQKAKSPTIEETRVLLEIETKMKQVDGEKAKNKASGTNKANKKK